MAEPNPEGPNAWSVDDLIFQLFEREDAPWSAKIRSRIKNPKPIEEAIRKNDLDGEVFLSITEDELKQDVGVHSLGQRRVLLEVSLWLRGVPPGAARQLSVDEKVHRYQNGIATPEITQSRIERSPAYSQAEVHPSVEQQYGHFAPRPTSGHPSLPIETPLPILEHQHNRPSGFVTSEPQTAPAFLPSTAQTTQFSNAVGFGETLYTPTPQTHPFSHQNARQATQLEAGYYGPPPEVKGGGNSEPGNALVVEDSRQRQQEPNTLDLLEKHIDKSLLRAAGEHTSDEAEQSKALELETPQQPVKKKRRVVPELINASKPKLSRAMTVPLADTFNDQDDDFAEDFILIPGKRNPSLCVATAKRIQRYLLRPQQQTAQRFDLGEWGYLLDLFPPESDDALALPHYGHSGDENDYDEATWKEIEKDRSDDKAVPSFLTAAEVDAVITEAISDLQKQWLEHKLHRAQARSHSLWKKCARARQRRPEINRLQAQKSLLDKRERKYRQGILDQPWRSVADVRKQCLLLEQTVFDQMDINHRLGVLQSDEEPPRPTKSSVQRSKRLRPALEDGEEILESESDADEDFVVDDGNEHVQVSSDAIEEDWQPEFRDGDTSTPKTTDSIEDLLSPPPRLVKAVPKVSAGDFSDETSANEGDIDSDDDDDKVISPADKRRLHGKPKSPITPRSKLSEVIPIEDDEVDVADATDEENSDLDAPPRLPPSRFKRQGKNEAQAIDLTLSDPMEIDDVYGDATDYSIRTPELNPPDTPEENASSEKPQIRLKLKVAASPSPVRPDHVKRKAPSPSKQPPLNNVRGIQNLVWELIEAREDQTRALRKAIYSLEPTTLNTLSSLIEHLAARGKLIDRERLLKEGILALADEQSNIPGVSSKYQADAYLLILLFVTYACAKNFVKANVPSDADRNLSYDAADNESDEFFDQTQQGIVAFQSYLAGSVTAETKGHKGKSKAGNAHLDDPEVLSDDEPAFVGATPSSHKKRKRVVVESQEALDQQEEDRERILEQERRRMLLQSRLELFAADKHAVIAINTSQPTVYLHVHIAARVKPHQVRGIQFLWREVIEDRKHQGCLLAHTMGLGKTMQVIALLVTIALCNNNDDQNVRNLIPEHLKVSKTLVLCPASLLDNWFDEFLMWLPHENLLGDIYKITSSSQIKHVEAWSKKGGVLLMSYQLFQSLLKPSKFQRDKRTKTEQDNINKWLLKDPNLVIADEAHSMKNPKSNISSLASMFATKSRIALTGSPLNNHLAEYHTMIDWLAPGYLGTLVQFKAKYVEPIIEGLYAESDPRERKISLRKLHVLKKDLAAKVDRADISVLEADLPSKTEYFITISLTELQKKAYDMYVDYMLQKHDEAESVGKRRGGILFEIIGVMSLLLNHPKCFIDKVNEKAREQEKKLLGATDSELPKAQSDREASSDAPTPQQFSDDVKVSSQHLQALHRAKAVFDECSIFGSLSHPSMSHRSLIVHQILNKGIALEEKTLLFSHSIPSLDYLEGMLKRMKCKYARIDGKTAVSKRQSSTKQFNEKDDDTLVFLISIKAGGLGLNLQGATRVIIYDFGFNPMWELQAVGRAYRLGQKKPVYVYRFRCGGTYEDVINNKAVFKDQLFQRVVDKKNPQRYATRTLSDYLKPSKQVRQHDINSFIGSDPDVLDEILDEQNEAYDEDKFVRNIELVETFHKEADEKLEGEDLRAAEAEYEAQYLERTDPEAYARKYPAGHLTPTRSAIMQYPGRIGGSSQDFRNHGVKRKASTTWDSSSAMKKPMSESAGGFMPKPTVSGLASDDTENAKDNPTSDVKITTEDSGLSKDAPESSPFFDR